MAARAWQFLGGTGCFPGGKQRRGHKIKYF
jgi:hypothetical protein